MPENEEPAQRTAERADRERLHLPGEGDMWIPVPPGEQIHRDLGEVAKPKKKRPPPKR